MQNLAVTPARTRAAVTVGRHRTVLQELPLPAVTSHDGLLRVEGCGVCGSDVASFDAEVQEPRVMGHETVGVIAAIGHGAAARWGAQEGDRVLLEEYLPCGHCRFCRSSEFRHCLESDPSTASEALRYGTTPLRRSPGVWGGFSDFQYLHERTVLHRVPATMPTALATLALPIANGYEWAHVAGGVGPGDSILVLGPGQQGLGCVLAARVAGASSIIVVGLERDAERLEVARALGATYTLFDGDDLAHEVLSSTGGEGVDVVVDAATGAEQQFNLGVEVLRKGGRMVVPVRRASLHDGVRINDVSRKALTVIGARGHSFEAVERAIGLIEDNTALIEPMSSLSVGLSGVSEAILAMGGRPSGRSIIHATVVPGMDNEPAADVATTTDGIAVRP